MRIKVMAELGKAALVEWYDGTTQRAIVPLAAVQGDQIDDGDLAAGVPYGVPWQDHVSAELAAELRRVGIWTGRDLAERPQLAAAAIQRVMSVHLATLRTAAAQYEAGGKR